MAEGVVLRQGLSAQAEADQEAGAGGCWRWCGSRRPARRFDELSAPVVGRDAAAGDDRDRAGLRAGRLLIADEPTTALDVTMQAQVLRPAAPICRREHGMAICSSRMTWAWWRKWPIGWR
jgi:hypothetical protein